MRTRIMLLVGVLLTVALTFLMAAPATMQSGDEDAIRKLSQDFTAALNKGDAKAAAALFTADGDYVSSTGVTGRGAAEIEKMVSSQAAGAFKGLTFKTMIAGVRVVKPDVAISNGSFESSTRKGLVTMVTVRDGGRWRIAALRAMVPAPGK